MPTIKISTTKMAKTLWVSSRTLFVLVPACQAIARLITQEWADFVAWFAMTACMITMVMMERLSFKHGFHFGQVMIMWCISHGITPREFAELPEPEPWDVSHSEKTTGDDHGQEEERNA